MYGFLVRMVSAVANVRFQGLGDLNRALAWYRRVLDVDEG